MCEIITTATDVLDNSLEDEELRHLAQRAYAAARSLGDDLDRLAQALTSEPGPPPSAVAPPAAEPTSDPAHPAPWRNPRWGKILAGPIRMDIDAHELWIDDERVRLPLGLWNLMRALAANPGRMISMAQLQELAWGRVVAENTFYSHIMKLRQAVEPHLTDGTAITAVRSLGYKLDVAPGRTSAPSPREVGTGEN